MSVVKTRAVAGAARRVKGTDGQNLTHAAELDEEGGIGRVLCGRVLCAHILDDPFAVEDEDAPPTCPVCLDRDPRGGVYETAMARAVSDIAAIEALLGAAETRLAVVARAWDEDTDTSLTERQACLAEDIMMAVASLRGGAESLRQVAVCLRDVDQETIAREIRVDEIRDAIDTGPLFELRRKLDRLA